MIVVIEGVDGAGKSETGKELARSRNGLFYPTPPPAYMARRHEIDAHATDEDHYRFYLEGVIAASKELEVLRAAHPVIVVDRYWLTTVVYHRVMGIKASLNDFPTIVQPDLTIYLIISPEMQMQRLTLRGMSAGDIRMLTRQSMIRKEYEALLPTLAGKVVCIDTGEKTVGEVVQQILLHGNLA